MPENNLYINPLGTTLGTCQIICSLYYVKYLHSTARYNMKCRCCIAVGQTAVRRFWPRGLHIFIYANDNIACTRMSIPPHFLYLYYDPFL
jgi:hypothetical protein